MRIIPRAEWGAKPWRSTPYAVPARERAWFLVHYHGGPPRHDRGDANAREIEAIHLANGWGGIGYNFIVGQDGAIREGRGWGLVGAHCPGRNRNGIGVYVAVGGDQKPTLEALAAVRWLYDEACRRSGRTLRKSFHGYDYPTACPGPHLTAWVKAGMPPTERDEIDMATIDELSAAIRAETDPLAKRLYALEDRQSEHIDWTRKAVNAAAWTGPARTVARLAPVLARATGIDQAALAAAIADAIRDDLRDALKDAPGTDPAAVADELARRLTQDTP